MKSRDLFHKSSVRYLLMNYCFSLVILMAHVIVFTMQCLMQHVHAIGANLTETF